MVSNIIPDPPMLPTDIPTQEVWYGGSDMHRYADQVLNDGYSPILDMAVLPNGFGIPGYARGLCVAFTSQQPGEFGGPVLRVALHKPGAKLADYQSNWRAVPDITLSLGSGNFNEGTTQAKVVAQRQGEFVYVFGRTVITVADEYSVWKITRNEYTQIVYAPGTGYSGALHIGIPNAEFFVSDDETPFIWHTYEYAGYKDDLGAGGGWVLGFTEDGTPLGSETYNGDYYPVFDESIYDYAAPGTGYNLSGKTAGFKQKTFIPAGQYGRGPILTHPWVSGSYGPPELWYFMMEFDSTGATTGCFNIYRSTWGRGYYERYDNPAPEKPLGYITEVFTDYDHPGVPVADPTTFNYHPYTQRTVWDQPIVITDDPDFMSHATQFPMTNPNGYAFETNWFSKKNFVGKIGPFPCGVYNPTGTAVATTQNAENTVGTAGFPGYYSPLNILQMEVKIVRDVKTRGILHMVIGDGLSHPIVDFESWNGFWHATSLDDGQTWGDPIQLLPGAHGTDSHVEGKLKTSTLTTYNGPLSVVRTFDDATLIGGGYHKAWTTLDGTTTLLETDSGSHVSFIVMDYNYTGAGGPPAQSPVIFRAGEARGKVWQ